MYLVSPCFKFCTYIIVFIAVRCPITSDVLAPDFGLVNPEKRVMTFTPLHKDEFPKQGDIIGLDAEFVSLNQVGTCIFVAS